MTDGRDIFNLGICPACGSAAAVKVRHTEKPRRYLKCEVCTQTWVTLEIIERDFWLEDAFNALSGENRLSEYSLEARRLIKGIFEFIRSVK